MVHDPRDLENNVQSFERIFDRKDAEGDCLVIQGIEDVDILAKVDLLCPDPFLFKFFQFSPVYNHYSPLGLDLIITTDFHGNTLNFHENSFLSF
jgi:hypothetical protein